MRLLALGRVIFQYSSAQHLRRAILMNSEERLRSLRLWNYEYCRRLVV
jgi:hypothetical protein